MPGTGGNPDFESDFLRRARMYQMRRLYVGLVSSALEFGAVLALLLWYLNVGASKPVGGAFWSGFATFSLIALSKMLISLPFDIYGGYVLAHRKIYRTNLWPAGCGTDARVWRFS